MKCPASVDEDPAVDPLMTTTFQPITIEQYAAICAEVAEGDEPVGALLGRRGLQRADYEAASVHYDQVLMAEQTEGDQGELTRRYCEAFVRTQDGLKPLPPRVTEPEQWAELAFAVGNDGPAALAAWGLSRADWARLNRHWARALGKNVAWSRRYTGTFFKLARSAQQATAEQGGTVGAGDIAAGRRG
jgi:hypothetical protein